MYANIHTARQKQNEIDVSLETRNAYWVTMCLRNGVLKEPLPSLAGFVG